MKKKRYCKVCRLALQPWERQNCKPCKRAIAGIELAHRLDRPPARPDLQHLEILLAKYERRALKSEPLFV